MPDFSWLRRFVGSLRTRAFEREMSAEFAAHLEFEVEALVAHGWAAADARIEARRRFGSVAQAKDLCRDSWGIRAVGAVAQDLRHGARVFAKNPGSPILIVLTLAIGIGMTTAIFSAVHAVLLQRLPYMNGEALVEIQQQRAGTTSGNLGLSLPELEDYRRQLSSLDALVEYHQMWFNLIEGTHASRVMTGVVSSAFFDVIGIKPILGRTFVPDDELPGAVPVLVVSHSYWQRALGADPLVVGRAVEMNDKVHHIVGVLPAVPQFPEDTEQNDVYMPVTACPFHARAAEADDRRMRIVSAIGRIRSGRTLSEVQEELSALSGTLATTFPAAYPAGFSANALSVRHQLATRARPTLTTLMMASCCVLLLVCANVGNLMLSRLVPREHELKMRAALGASSSRLVRQLLLEAAALALAGGALGLALAALGRGMLTSYVVRLTPRATEIAIDRTVVFFAAAVTILTALGFGLLPAWRMTRTGASLEKRPTSRFLLVPQVAISFVLLGISLQMTRHLITVVTSDAGFTSEQVLTAQLDLDWTRYSTDEARREFFQDLLARLDRTPEARHAALSLTFPLNDGGGFWRTGLLAEDETDSDMPQVDLRLASPGYFAAVGMTVLRGRSFTTGDLSDSRVVLVNQSVALRRFRGDPIGRRVSLDAGRSWNTIVGIVNDVKQYGLDTPPVEEVYLPFGRYAPLSATLLVPTAKDAGTVLRQIEDAIRSIDPRQPLSRVRTLDDVRDSTVAPVRMTTTLVTWLAAIALFISAAGVAGAVWVSVNQRLREIGIRLALGESPARVAFRVAGSGLGAVVVGLVVGLPFALAANRFEAAGAGFQSVGPGTMSLSVMAILTVAGVACMAPARRAASISPTAALRVE
jgi:putative ABC transport system permease protein